MVDRVSLERGLEPEGVTSSAGPRSIMTPRSGVRLAATVQVAEPPQRPAEAEPTAACPSRLGRRASGPESPRGVQPRRSPPPGGDRISARSGPAKRSAKHSRRTGVQPVRRRRRQGEAWRSWQRPTPATVQVDAHAAASSGGGTDRSLPQAGSVGGRAAQRARGASSPAGCRPPDGNRPTPRSGNAVKSFSPGKHARLTRGRKARPSRLAPTWPLGHGLNENKLLTALPFRAGGACSEAKPQIRHLAGSKALKIKCGQPEARCAGSVPEQNLSRQRTHMEGRVLTTLQIGDRSQRSAMNSEDASGGSRCACEAATLSEAKKNHDRLRRRTAK